ncbi:hypothetical protein FGADI_11198 [Fusarium gaditjirri]|uniref:Uncharacterized protein n=1 Tax=Fusarium gaditjirri TaxID=282569 RepID=A0A8H4WQK6_9HYPO|nr:hypothetical protein FGADI_11198 [Fusarium gaditjirri]
MPIHMASDLPRRRGRPLGSKDSYAPRIKRGLAAGQVPNNRAPRAPNALSDDEIRMKLDKKAPPPDLRMSLARES